MPGVRDTLRGNRKSGADYFQALGSAAVGRARVSGIGERDGCHAAGHGTNRIGCQRRAGNGGASRNSDCEKNRTGSTPACVLDSWRVLNLLKWESSRSTSIVAPGRKVVPLSAPAENHEKRVC